MLITDELRLIYWTIANRVLTLWSLLLFAARRFDFFDMGMMDILQYRLEKAESIMRGPEVEVTFKGRIIGKRRSDTGDDEYRVTWAPSNM